MWIASFQMCSGPGNEMSTMRRSIVRSRVALALLVVLAVLSARVRAQDLFYEAYQNGIKEFKADNLDAARRLFERALQLDSKQSRRRLFYGRLFSEYLPEYYLALISIKQKQPDRARAYLQNLEGAGLLKPGDPQHATLTAQLNAAAPAVTTNARNKSASTPPAASETPPSTAAAAVGRGNASEQPARPAENAGGEKAVVSAPAVPP